MERENRWRDAKAYFHRAVFGRWGADSLARRRQARFELIDLLARRGAPRELLAELLPFEETSAATASRFVDRLGQLFIAGWFAGASGEHVSRGACAAIRATPTPTPRMGEAALALGNFRTARADFAEAARLRPSTIASPPRRQSPTRCSPWTRWLAV